MIDSSAWLMRSAPPQSATCKLITSRKRRTYVLRPSTPTSNALPLVTRLRACRLGSGSAVLVAGIILSFGLGPHAHEQFADTVRTQHRAIPICGRTQGLQRHDTLTCYQ